MTLLSPGISIYVIDAFSCVAQAPWGGKKASGYGRELGTYGLDSYLSVKQVTSYVSKERWDWYPVESKL